MNLRLQITTRGGAVTTFAHSGPVIRIGRDPSCELALEGEAADTVSRQHARIELGATGSTLADLGSSNGTLLNDRPVQGTVPLRAGDSIRLGHTGAQLKVLALDLTATPPPVPAGSRPPLPRPVLLAASGGVALLVLVVGLYLVFHKAPPPPAQPNQSPEMAAAQPAREEPRDPRKGRHPEEIQDRPEPKPNPAGEGPKKEGGRPKPPDQEPPAGEGKKNPPAPDPEDAPAVADRELGTYKGSPGGGPSVLLQRRGRGFAWVRLGPGDKVQAGNSVLSLPGYRSTVALASGVDLTLWGTLPDFEDRGLPVRESAVVLNDPGDADLDLVLSRGRVHLLNSKQPPGPARVRLRFANQAWELTLPDGQSEAGIEFLSLPWRGVTAKDPPRQVAELHLWAGKEVRLKAGGRDLVLHDREHVGWHGEHPTPPAVDRVEPRHWWTAGPDTKDPKVASALGGLLLWNDLLTQRKQGDGGPLDVIRSRVQDGAVADDIGLLFLGALDSAPLLLTYLRDRDRPDLWGTALASLQGYLGRGPQYGPELVGQLEKEALDTSKAKLIVQLMHFLPREALGKATYLELADLLNHTEWVVRKLALWHLSQLGGGGLLPKEAKGVDYDPAWEAEKRQPAVEKLKKILRDAKAPARPRG